MIPTSSRCRRRRQWTSTRRSSSSSRKWYGVAAPGTAGADRSMSSPPNYSRRESLAMGVGLLGTVGAPLASAHAEAAQAAAMQDVGTIAALRASTLLRDSVFVRGYYSPHDMGGGVYVWNPG